MDDKKPSWFDPDLEDHIAPAAREAIAWSNRLQGDKVTERDRVAFRAWLRDPRNAAAFAQIEALWSGLSGLPEAKRRRRNLTRRNFGVGALALMTAGGGWAAYRLHPFADYRTATGERRSITLPDGSDITLASSTALSTRFTPTERLITLHDGEAYFDVAPAPDRPFMVDTSRGRVTALGTAFAAAEGRDKVTVTVTQHAVQVSSGAQRLRMEAGQQASMNANGISAPVAVDPADVLAWREGRLIFVNARLDDVLDALNRWRSGRLVMIGNVLAAHPVTLIVNLQHVDIALRQLQDALPVEFTDVTPLLTVVHAR